VAVAVQVPPVATVLAALLEMAEPVYSTVLQEQQPGMQVAGVAADIVSPEAQAARVLAAQAVSMLTALILRRVQ
jgi:hypothetical protein